MKTDIAIIGNGCAALSAVGAIRESGFQGRIDLFDAGSLPAYNPMLLPYFLSGRIPPERLNLLENPEAFYAQNALHLHSGAPVVRLAAREKRLETADGTVWSYDQCLIASGASPFVPPVQGAHTPGVFTLRTAEDALRIRAYMQRHAIRSALVVGASMVGVKAMEFFMQSGVACCLADLAPHIFPRSAHPHCAAHIERRLAAQGVQLRFGQLLERITREGDTLCASFAGDPAPIAADVILLCSGVRPNLSFVDPGEVDIRTGVVVDSAMRTSCPGLYAAGDCAAGRDVYYRDHRVTGLMASARMQGRTAGRNMAGIPDSFAGSTPHNIIHFMDMDFVALGDPAAQGEPFEQTFPDGRYARIVRDGERLVSVNLLNMKDVSGLLKNLFFKTQDVPLAADSAVPDYTEFVSHLLQQSMNPSACE